MGREGGRGERGKGTCRSSAKPRIERPALISAETWTDASCDIIHVVPGENSAVAGHSGSRSHATPLVLGATCVRAKTKRDGPSTPFPISDGPHTHHPLPVDPIVNNCIFTIVIFTPEKQELPGR